MIRKDGVKCNELPGVTQEQIDEVAKLAGMFTQLSEETGKKETVVLTGVQKLIFYIIVKRYPSYNNIMCITRYGKSYVVSLALIVRMIMNPYEKWTIVAPTTAQASIIFNNIIEHLGDSDFLREYLPDSYRDKADRLSHEQSKKRITFNNHAEVRILSADADNKVGAGKSLMGHGTANLILDESCLIDDNIHSKIMRMIGDSKIPFYLEIGNPFYKNHFYNYYMDIKFNHIVADRDIALAEGRLTPEQDELMSKIPNYGVLYKCEFPDDDILDTEGFIPLFTENSLKVGRLTENDAVPEHLGRKVMGLDVSYSGNDANCWVVRSNNYLEVVAKDHSRSTMDIIGKTAMILKEEGMLWSDVYVDATGGGKIIYDRMVELGYNPQGVIFGEVAGDTEHFRDAKTEGYFKLYDWIAKGGHLSSDNSWNELKNIKYKLTSTSKCYIISKDELKKRGIRSPDAADAAALTCMRGAADFIYINPERKKNLEEKRKRINKYY